MLNFNVLLMFFLVVLIIIDIVLLTKYRQFVKFLLNKNRNIAAEEISKNWGYLADGSSGDIQLEVAWLGVAQEAFELFKKKNHDYGNDNLATGWLPGVAIRLGDKVSRLWTLVGLRRNSERQVKDEKLVDTFLDITNYGFIGSLMLKGAIEKKDIEEVISAKRKY